MNTIATLDRIVHSLVDQLHSHPFGQKLYAGTMTRDEYIAFLVQTYHYVVYTRPLLYQAGKRLASQGSTNLAQVLLQKADEEDGHEEWVLEDLRALGEGIELIGRQKPVSAVSAYITWNSFTVQHGSPVAFLGAAYVLEAMSAGSAAIVAKNLKLKSDIRGIDAALRFLSGHADADIQHIAELASAIETFATAESDRQDILLTAAITRSTYLGLCSALDAAHSAHTRAADDMLVQHKLY